MPRVADRRPLLSYLRVQEDLDRRILFQLQRSSSRIDQELRRLERGTVSDVVRGAQLRAARAEMQREIARLWRRVGSEVMAGRVEAANAAVESTVAFTDVLTRARIGRATRELMLRSMQHSAVRNLEHAMSRLTISQRSLSSRVYHSSRLVSGQLDRIIQYHLAKGSSARELAADIRPFVSARTPGGTRYAAQRLGRTELNAAFHATQVRTAAVNPFITGMTWQISGSHPKPDECDDYADETFLPEDVPGKPHPQCLCYLVPETVSRDQFINSFDAGEYDSFLNGVT